MAVVLFISCKAEYLFFRCIYIFVMDKVPFRSIAIFIAYRLKDTHAIMSNFVCEIHLHKINFLLKENLL